MLPPNNSNNSPRWNGQRQGFYEVWYLTMIQRSTGHGFWIRYTTHSPFPGADGTPGATLWFFFQPNDSSLERVAVKETLPFTQYKGAQSPFRVEIGDAFLSNGALRGHIAKGGLEVDWDLAFEPFGRTMWHVAPWMEKLKLAKSMVCCPNLNVPMSGRITINGTSYELRHDPAGQTHIWGTKRVDRLAWCHCNAFEGHPDAALEGLSVQVKKLGFNLPYLTAFHFEAGGKEYAFNTPGALLTNQSRYNLGEWEFSGAAKDTKCVVHLKSPIERYMGVNYQDPDGVKSYVMNTLRADVEVKIFKTVRSGWELEAEYLAKKTAASEFQDRKALPGVTFLV